MTAPKRMSAKLFIENPQDMNVDAVVPVFQRWIQQHTVEGLLIDVADYKHVYNGPGFILIAHEGDYAYTNSDGRAGLQYTLKNSSAENLTEALAIMLRRVLDAAEKFQTEREFAGVRVNFREIQVALVDRLRYPNEPDVVKSVHATVQEVANLLSDGKVTVQVVEEDKRNLITFVLQADTAIHTADVSQRLSAAQVG